jgi:hypothetical protein
VRSSRHRPLVALVQYWPAGQSVRVVQGARVHAPASQIKPAPHAASPTHGRRQSPSRQVNSSGATVGSTPGAQSVGSRHGGRHSPWVGSQRWPAGQPAAVVQGSRVSHRPCTHAWLAAQPASEPHRHRPCWQVKPVAQSVAWVHSARATHAPETHASARGHSLSSPQAGPQPPKRHRPPGHSASVSQGAEEVGGQAQSSTSNTPESSALDMPLPQREVRSASPAVA